MIHSEIRIDDVGGLDQYERMWGHPCPSEALLTLKRTGGVGQS